MDPHQWSPDELLPGYERLTLRLPADYDGRVVATLVRRRPTGPPARLVLYLHGFVDYFFQTHVAEHFLRRGDAFYALELRKFGRSRLPSQHANYVHDVREYYDDVTAAVDAVRGEEGELPLALVAHSTGGLVAALSAAEGERRQAIGALVLNSPFLEFHVSAVERKVLQALAAVGGVFPFAVVPGVFPPAYGQSVSRAHHGEWEIDERHKPVHGFAVYAGWLRAMLAAHRRVQLGLGLELPVLLLHSDRSLRRRRWHPDLMSCDAVLDVDHMRAIGPTLGDRVTLAEVPGAMHDVMLSRPEVRARALAVVTEWLDEVLPPAVARPAAP
jgi:alpha-beta hydrolase superfamily lysophospholipase